MPASHEQMVDFLRAIHARPGGTGGLLNLIRGSEVRGAADIAALSELVTDQQAKLDLARHGFDEARHAYLLLRRMNEIGFAPFRLPLEVDRVDGLFSRCRARDVKQVYSERGWVGEAELMELLVASFIPEHDAVGKLRANFEVLAGDPGTQAVIGAIARDEERHVEYLGRWLQKFERRFSRRAVAATRERLEEVFQQQEVVYYAALQEYFDRAAA